MGHRSDPADLALHGVRVLGFPTSARIAARFGLHREAVEEDLLDAEACGWVRTLTFGATSGWSLTDAGRTEGERRLSAELDRTGCRATVTSVHARFLPLNRRFAVACTDWQVRPTRLDPMALNDHTDRRWDERVLRTPASLERAFRDLCDELAALLTRFDGYGDRFSSAWRQVEAGRRAWLDAPDRGSAPCCGSRSTRTC